MNWRNISLSAIAAASLLAACKSEDTSVIDESYKNATPHIQSLIVTPQIINTGNLPPTTSVDSLKPFDTVSIAIRVQLTLAKGTAISSINSATVSINDGDGRFLTRLDLHHSAGDTAYDDSLTFPSLRKRVGLFKFTVQIVNSDGNTDVRSTTININNSSDKPAVLSIINMPDTVLIPPPDSAYLYLFALRAKDPEGPDDVASVTMDVFDTAGVQTNQNSFSLFDDGRIAEHGDSVAQDGIFSLIVRSDTSNKPAKRIFRFISTDKSFSSDTLRHPIIILKK